MLNSIKVAEAVVKLETIDFAEETLKMKWHLKLKLIYYIWIEIKVKYKKLTFFNQPQ